MPQFHFYLSIREGMLMVYFFIIYFYCYSLLIVKTVLGDFRGSMLAIWDTLEPELVGRRPPLCPVLYDGRLGAPFTRVFLNDEYSVLRVDSPPPSTTTTTKQANPQPGSS